MVPDTDLAFYRIQDFDFFNTFWKAADIGYQVRVLGFTNSCLVLPAVINGSEALTLR